MALGGSGTLPFIGLVGKRQRLVREPSRPCLKQHCCFRVQAFLLKLVRPQLLTSSLKIRLHQNPSPHPRRAVEVRRADGSCHAMGCSPGASGAFTMQGSLLPGSQREGTESHCVCPDTGTVCLRAAQYCVNTPASWTRILSQA